MSILMQTMMTNAQPQFAGVSALRNPRTGGLHGPRKMLLAVVGVVSIAFGAALCAPAYRVGEPYQSEPAVGISSAGAYRSARVLEPNSRGNVVEV